MERYLVFTLSAAIGAMAIKPGTSEKGSQQWPARSAILGLLCNAMGLERGEMVARDRVQDFGVAVGVHAVEPAFVDFQTTRVVSNSVRKRMPEKLPSRAEFLHRAGRDVDFVISHRNYHTGLLYSVALWDGDLEAAEAALRQPARPLYLGRKCCSLSAPAAPRLVEAETPVEALSHAKLPPAAQHPLRKVISDTHPRLRGSTTWYHDDPVCPEKWLFRQRPATLIHMENS